MKAKLVALTGPLEGQSFPLPPLLTTLGGDPFSHITWTDPDLEEDHAHVAWRKGRHILVDLATESGTTVNGQRLDAPHVLQHGDVIRIGSSRFRYLASAPEPAAEPATAALPSSLRDSRATIPFEERLKRIRVMEPAPEAASLPNVPSFPLALSVLAIVIVALALLSLWVLPGLWRGFFAVPTSTPVPIPTVTATATATPRFTPVPSATFTAVARPSYYPVPIPLSPPDGAVGSSFLLEWSWRGALGIDEWYSLWVWREGAAPHSLAWTKEPRYPIGESLGAGQYLWQVLVVQGVAQGNWQRDLSAPSEIRRFTLLSLTSTPTLTWTPTSTPTATATSSPTHTHTPEPLARIIVSGRIYDGRVGPAAPLPAVEVRVYVADQRAVARSDAFGQYTAEFSLRGHGGLTHVDVLASAPGVETGVAKATLSSYAPGTTQLVAIDLGLFPAATTTPTWMPPTSTPTP